MADHGELPAALSVGAVRLGGDQLAHGGQRAQSLATPQRFDSGGEAITQSRGAFIVTAFGERGDPVDGRGQCGVVPSVDQGRCALRRRGVLRGGDVAVGGAGRHFELGAGRTVQSRSRQAFGAGSDPGESSQQGCRVSGVGAGSKWAEHTVVSRGTDHRQARERFIGQHHPPPPMWEPRPAVVRRGMRSQHPQFTDTGLQRMRALDMVDRASQRDHLFHPATRIGAVEVLADASTQVDRGAHVEHLARRSAEQVDPRPVR
ncbi:hypothetical protein MSIMFI_03573 [Mycobacterium simulans]|nr:hypothetical protein MSIMFI_03573 [Mycobacterium simulans]